VKLASRQSRRLTRCVTFAPLLYQRGALGFQTQGIVECRSANESARRGFAALDGPETVLGNSCEVKSAPYMVLTSRKGMR